MGRTTDIRQSTRVSQWAASRNSPPGDRVRRQRGANARQELQQTREVRSRGVVSASCRADCRRTPGLAARRSTKSRAESQRPHVFPRESLRMDAMRRPSDRHPHLPTGPRHVEAGCRHTLTIESSSRPTWLRAVTSVPRGTTRGSLFTPCQHVQGCPERDRKRTLIKRHLGEVRQAVSCVRAKPNSPTSHCLAA
jgi:hypothetical protein